MKILISSPSCGEVFADLSNENPKTSQLIWDTLPIDATVNTWGDEIYFSIPVNVEIENPSETVNLGDLGYWPPGHAFCIFYGLTPASRGDEIRPASPVNVFGKIIGDPKVFKKVSNGDLIKIEKAPI